MDATLAADDEGTSSVRASRGPAFWAACRGVVNGAVDFVLPHRCAACGCIVPGNGGFCGDCWMTLEFIAGAACARCDLPLPSATGPDTLCGGCISNPPPYSRVHVPLAYGPATRRMVLRLKYGRRTGTAPLMGALMHRCLPRPVEGDPSPVLVPVPLHRWRLWSRGFNQSAELARAIADRAGYTLAVDALTRTHATVPLRGLGRTARARVVRGAFAMNDAGRAAIADRTVILVDDVFTTGATVAAASKALLRGGAARVEIAAFARVLDDGGQRSDGIDSLTGAPDIFAR